jgi:4'-phosphopantetheinyl transferase
MIIELKQNPYIAAQHFKQQLTKKEQHEKAYELLCLILNKYCHFRATPETLKIGRLESGKPYLIDYPHIHFSISHSKFAVACAVYDKHIGVDIENIRNFSTNVTKRVCTKEEQTLIDNSENKEDTFFRMWTFKESYVKLTGDGLSYGLKNVSFDPYNKETNITDISFCQFKLCNDFIVTCCFDK